MPTTPDLPAQPATILIPAHNEAQYVGSCLRALLEQTPDADPMRVIVAANACKDETVALSAEFIAQFAARGGELRVLDLPEPGKIAALNSAEAGLEPGVRIYLDADVIVDPQMVGQLRNALAPARPLYGTGRLAVAPARSAITRAYARLWQELPFFKTGAVGAGLFALNAAGRARWGAFPDIISDDTFVRLNFAPDDRIEVRAYYHWPMIEGWTGLVKVRRRQDAGVTEIRNLYPEIMANDSAPELGTVGAMRLALRQPWDFLVYVSVALAVRTRRPSKQWVRGR